jgi:GxxExxY protein
LNAFNQAHPRAKLIFPELSYQLIQIAFEVHNCLGPGFTENIYEQAFALELENKGIHFERQKEILVSYKGINIGAYRLDLVIEEKIIVELKAVAILNDLCKQQVLSYLRATGLYLGLVINFGQRKVETFRVANAPLLNQEMPIIPLEEKHVR